MDKILFINACVRPESRTYELAKCVLSRLEGQVEELVLNEENIPPLSNELLEKRNAILDAEDYSHPMLRYARQLAGADTIVIAAPYWDLIFPATVRLWFEHICVTGLTFRYSPEGFPVSLCKAKRMIYVTTAGGPIFEGFNFGYDYAKAVCEGYFGIHDCCCIKAENLDIVGADVEGILANAKEEIAEIIPPQLLPDCAVEAENYSEYMGNKYKITSEIPERLFPEYEGWEYTKVCRYGDGYVYRMQKSVAMAEELPWQSRLLFSSSDNKALYLTVVYDQIRLHMTDFEHGVPYLTGVELLSGHKWTECKSAGEVWLDTDLEQLSYELIKVTP